MSQNQIAAERLYLTADKDKLVGEGDTRAATLYAAEGDEIPASAAAQFGLVDGKLPKKKGKGDPGADEKAAAEAAAKAQAEKEAAEKAAAEKAAAEAAEKGGKAPANKAAKAPANKGA